MHRQVVRIVVFVFAVAGIAFSGGPARAGGKFEKSKEPIYLEDRPDRAVIYLVRTESPRMQFPVSTHDVFLDQVPIGHLRGRSYIASYAEPGTRLLWGPDPGTPLWVELEAGRTYLFRLDEVWGAEQRGNAVVAVLQGSTWSPDNAGTLRALVERWDLPCITITEEGIADLKQDAAEGFAAARRAAGPPASQPARFAPPPRPLPHTFANAAYRPEKRGLSFRVYESKGSLTIAKDSISYTSDKERITIPMSEVRAVSRGSLGVEQQIDWAIIEHGPEGATQVAGFTLRGGPDEILATLDAVLEGSRLAPMQRVSRAVESAEAFESSGSMNAPDLAAAMRGSELAQRFREQLAEVDPILVQHLESSPDDVEALFLQVRLDRMLTILSPVVIEGGKRREDPLAPKRDPQAALDRILELRPRHAVALYMKARLYGLTDPLEGTPAGLEKAIEFAGQAVQAAPQEPAYREALAIYLVQAGRPADAMQTLKEGPGPGHPIYRLLRDSTEFPWPEGAIEMPERAAGLAGIHSASGSLKDHALMRVRAFALTTPAAGAAAFYQARFPGLVLRDEKETEEGDISITMMSGLLNWEGQRLVPSRKRPDRLKELPDGVALLILETRNPPADLLADRGLPQTEVLTEIILTNFRDLSNP